MNKIFKCAMMAFALLVGACVLTSCGKDDEKNSPNIPQEQDSEIALTVGGLTADAGDAESKVLQYIADRIGGKVEGVISKYISVPNGSIEKITSTLKSLQSDTKWADEICRNNKVAAFMISLSYNGNELFSYSYYYDLVGRYEATDANGGKWILVYENENLEGRKYKGTVTVPAGYKIEAKEYTGYWMNPGGKAIFTSDEKVQKESTGTSTSVLSMQIAPEYKNEEFTSTIRINDGSETPENIKDIVFKRVK